MARSGRRQKDDDSLFLADGCDDPAHHLNVIAYGSAHSTLSLSAGSTIQTKRHRRSSSHGSTSTTSTAASSSSRTISRPSTPTPSSFSSSSPIGGFGSFPSVFSGASKRYGCSVITILITLLATMGLGVIMDSFVRLQNSESNHHKPCEMSYMSQSYIPMTSFNSSLTTFAGKYHLHLYREQGVDISSDPTGVPILFIPGNAGSFRQIRSIASSAALQFYDLLRLDQSTVLSSGMTNLDFFTVDFNEDFSAFHGQTLLEQADYLNDAIKYILSLYAKNQRNEDYSNTKSDAAASNPVTTSTTAASIPSPASDTYNPTPTSVILLGHSMGGVVARTMLTRKKFIHGSVNAVITMATPHLSPPVAFDWLVDRIYNDVNYYWRRSYSAKYAYSNPLEDVTLVSVAGGSLDTVVCSDTANINSLVPASHGFTVFTTSVPKVWTPIDHQCILWCDQFRNVIARALLDIVDARRPGKTKPREERLESLRKALLTGLEEDHPIQKKKPKNYYGEINLANVSHSFVGLGQRLVLSGLLGAKGTVHLMQIHGSHQSFSLLTDQVIGGSNSGNNNQVEVLLCDVMPTEVGGVIQMNTVRRYSSMSDRGQLRLACDRPLKDPVILPASSTRSTTTKFSTSTFSYLEFSLDDVHPYSYIAIVVKDNNNGRSADTNDGFIIAEYFDHGQVSEQVNVSIPELFFDGVRIENFPDQASLMSKLWIPAIDSSLISYKMQISRPGCEPQSRNPLLFSTLVRQSLPNVYESKFYTTSIESMSVLTTPISLHGSAPFVTPVSGPHIRKGLELQFWTDPSTCTAPLTIDIHMDYYASLGKVVMRFRSALVAFPFVIVAFTLRTQIREYNRSGVYISFGEGMSRFIRNGLSNLLIIVSFLSIFQSLIQSHTSYILADLFAFDRDLLAASAAVVSSAPKKISNKGIDLLLGNNDPFFWFLVPLFLILSIGIVALVWFTLAIVLHSLAFLSRFISKRFRLYTRLKKQQQRQQESNKIRRRLITTIILFLLVVTFIPYQFAFIVAFFVQVISTVRAINRAESAAEKHSLHFSSSSSKVARHRDRANYLSSILVLMLWLLPVNAPVLVVWIRNLAVHWLTPFSSDHNVLFIAPVIFYVEIVTSGKTMLPRNAVGAPQSIISYFLIWYLAVYALLYGVRYTYQLYFLSLLLFTWLVILHVSRIWGIQHTGGLMDFKRTLH